jgi:hypothetical protein
MIPRELKPEDFRLYNEQSRIFAVHYLAVLRRIAPAACPSFLLQINNIPTSFPAETQSLTTRLDTLQSMPAPDFNAHTATLRGIELPVELLRRDWINDPATFITAMTAYLWSSGQIDRFREGTQSLFAALPEPQSNDDRLLIVVAGQDARPAESDLGKLRKHGLLVQNLVEPDTPARLLQAVQERALTDPTPYNHWYIDGGVPWASKTSPAGITHVSYPTLAPLRGRVLARMKDTIFSGDAGTEAMQTRLASLTPEALQAHEVVEDEILQRFYTELFTLSSGPQIFSTSFVQWAGRELMRRAQPRTLLLRYAPRQHHRPFNEMVAQAEAETILDPGGSLRDASMGAYYAWLEGRRMAPSAKLAFLLWLEGTSKLLVIAPGAPAGTETSTPLTLAKVLSLFS